MASNIVAFILMSWPRNKAEPDYLEQNIARWTLEDALPRCSHWQAHGGKLHLELAPVLLDVARQVLTYHVIDVDFSALELQIMAQGAADSCATKEALAEAVRLLPSVHEPPDPFLLTAGGRLLCSRSGKSSFSTRPAALAALLGIVDAMASTDLSPVLRNYLHEMGRKVCHNKLGSPAFMAKAARELALDLVRSGAVRVCRRSQLGAP